MGLREDILALATLVSGGSPIGDPETDFIGAFGLSGDEATEFFELFADQYEGSLDGFLWYFHFVGHAPSEPVSRDGRRIRPMPVTLADLVRAAESGRWPLTYPRHSIRGSFPARLRITSLMAGLLFLVVAATLFPFL